MLSSIRESDLIKKVIVVMSGTLMAQLIALAATPIITRLYSPEAFGYFSNVSAIAVVLVTMLTLSYSLAVVLPKHINNALALVKVTILLSVAISFLLLIVEAITGLSEYLNLGAISFNELVVFALAMAVFEVLGYWLVKVERFKFRANLLVVQALLVASLKIAAGCYQPIENSLLYSTLIGLIAVNLILILCSGVSLRFGKRTLQRGLLNARRYSHVAKFRTPQNLLANLNQLMPILLLTTMYSASVAGMYALARTVLLLPGLLIAKSVGDVLFPRLNTMYHNHQVISGVVAKSVLSLCVIGLIPLSIIWSFGEELFAFIFGEEWRVAGEYAKWLSVWLYFNFVNKPYVTLIPILKLEKAFLKNSALNTCLTLAGLWLGYEFQHDAMYSIAYFCLLTVIPQIIILYVTHKTMRNSDLALSGNKA